jgi:hypothetical protein
LAMVLSAFALALIFAFIEESPVVMVLFFISAV